jgi:hypothetical protein
MGRFFSRAVMEDADLLRCFDHDAHDHPNSTAPSIAKALAHSDRH